MPEASDAARILVVDDERVIREILAEFLTLEGFSVNTVEDGEKALTELRTRPYDLVISDLKMPRVSGLQLLEKITGTAVDSPLCMTCGTKMRPAGSCYVCEGCGSTSGCS